MANLIIVGILVLLMSIAVSYLWKEKKKGTRCIGCSASGCCSAGTCTSREETCHCHSEGNTKPL